MLPIDDAARGAAAHGYAKSAQVADDVLSGFLWRPHMQQHGLEITESPSMSRWARQWRCDRLTDQNGPGSIKVPILKTMVLGISIPVSQKIGDTPLPCIRFPCF